MKYQSARSITTKNLRPSSITKKDICDLHVKDERITVFVNTYQSVYICHLKHV